MLTQEELKKHFDYCLETGIFTRLKTGKNNWCTNGKGYYVIKINGKIYLLHRLAWLYVHGKMPKDQIDHINTNKSDNRFFNLRECSRVENSRNKKIYKNNKSGFKGVHFNNHLKKWHAQSKINGKKIYIGIYETAEQAGKAYAEFAKKNFGKFANY